jgi:hypothetical protein
VDDKDILARSHAGIRLIALATLYNKGDFTRVRAYLKENFAPEALEQSPVALRLAEMREQYRETGKVRVQQVLTYDKHHVVVLLATQNSGMILEDLRVEEPYPHRIVSHQRQTVV